MPNTQSYRERLDNLRLIDHNIKNSRELVGWWCDNCKRKLYYPANAPIPQCPHCSTRGQVARMRRYYGGITLVTNGGMP